MQGGLFLPIRTGRRRVVRIAPEAGFLCNGNGRICKANTPFFYIMTEEGMVKQFIEAVTNSQDADDVKPFISKAFNGRLDFTEIRDAFQSGLRYKCLLKAEFRYTPPNCKTNSIVLFQETNDQDQEQEHTRNTIIHLHMVREPDRFGQWKIYGIEKESCRK